VLTSHDNSADLYCGKKCTESMLIFHMALYSSRGTKTNLMSLVILFQLL